MVLYLNGNRHISLIIYNYLLFDGNMRKQRLYNAIAVKANILVLAMKALERKQLSSLHSAHCQLNIIPSTMPLEIHSAHPANT
jgi:hypothetical protein